MLVSAGGSNAGFVWAADGRMDWRRDIRVQPSSTSTVRLVTMTKEGTAEASVYRSFMDDKGLTMLAATGSTNIKYPRRVRGGYGLTIDTAPNLTLTDASTEAELQSTLDGITWTTQLEVRHNAIGFFAATPVAKPTVSGAKASNAAVASLLTALAKLGLIADSTSA